MGFTDADLIARVLAAGDPNAFGELVRRYQSPVRAFLRRLTRGDAALADDLAQETFLRAWRKLETFRAEARFSTWLFGIAVNEFRARLRRDRRHLWGDNGERARCPRAGNRPVASRFAPGPGRSPPAVESAGARGDLALLPARADA